MVTATLATNNDHEHFEHDGVTDEPLGGAIQEVSHPTPGLLNIVEVHPTEGARGKEKWEYFPEVLLQHC